MQMIYIYMLMYLKWHKWPVRYFWYFSVKFVLQPSFGGRSQRSIIAIIDHLFAWHSSGNRFSISITLSQLVHLIHCRQPIPIYHGPCHVMWPGHTDSDTLAHCMEHAKRKYIRSWEASEVWRSYELSWLSNGKWTRPRTPGYTDTSNFSRKC